MFQAAYLLEDDGASFVCITIITTTNILSLITIVALFMLCPLRALTQTAEK